MSTKFNHIIEDPGSFDLFASMNSEEIYFKFFLHPWSVFNQAQSKMVPAVSSKQYPEKNNNKQQLYSAYYTPAFYIH